MLIPRALRVTAIRLAVVALVAVGCVSFLDAPKAALAAPVAINQCNGFGPGDLGATNRLECTVEIVNTIDGPNRSSTVTVTRQCSLNACPGGGNTTSDVDIYTDVVTSVSQCNNSANDAQHPQPIRCHVDITNNISADTDQLEPLDFATLNQCDALSADGTGGMNTCDPPTASTSGATVTQCNGSARSTNGRINCSFDGYNVDAKVSEALPITVNQCNTTGNAGSTVTCTSKIRTNITPAFVGGGTSGGTTGGTTGSTTAGSTTGGSSGSSSGGTTGSTSGGTGGTSGSSTGSTTSGAVGSTGGSNLGGGGSTGSGSTGGSGGSSGATTGGEGTSTGSGSQVRGIPRGGVDAGGGSTAGHTLPVLPLLALLGLATGAAVAWRRRAGLAR